jgi:Ribulose-5-phosphate 4-epimerase and related epimerases and aldolases
MSNSDTYQCASQLALANHILVANGILDAFGHVSCRHPDLPDRFMISRNMAPSLVTDDDILTVDFDGVVEGDTRTTYLERFIHAEIYRQRPDVKAIVHSHAASVVPFTISKSTKLCPVCHMSGFLAQEVGVFEIRDLAGSATDLLIRNPALGRSLAAKLGDDAVILMRGHGMTVVGRDIKQAVFRAVYTEANARIQISALALGAFKALTAEEAMAADVANNSQIGRAWDYWASNIVSEHSQ